MTVPGYVDSDDLVWRRRWFDSTSATTRTFNVDQCVVMVCDTSSLNPETATILLFSHASRPPAMQEATIISNSRHTTSPPGALRWVGPTSVNKTSYTADVIAPI